MQALTFCGHFLSSWMLICYTLFETMVWGSRLFFKLLNLVMLYSLWNYGLRFKRTMSFAYFKCFLQLAYFLTSKVYWLKKKYTGVCKLLKMETYVDFFNWLDHDTLMRILICLEDPSDLVRVSSVSRSWREFGE